MKQSECGTHTLNQSINQSITAQGRVHVRPTGDNA
jgi:hypothetical protein